MSGEQNVEIDLSRQMLLFTSIAAAFTGMTLIGTGVIPISARYSRLGGAKQRYLSRIQDCGSSR
jgi:hypothetical protein